MSKRSDVHDRVLNARSLEDIEAGYRAWAGDYDQDLIDGAGYVAPKQCADALGELLPDSGASVLDAGCGTGLVGVYLAEAGIDAIDGIDFSQDMLDVAAEKNCYRSLLQADLNQPLDIPSNHYGASVCVGTFTTGHVRPEALFELIRVTESGGPICFTVRDSFWKETGFQEVIDKARERGIAELVSQAEMPYIKEEGSSCHQVMMRSS